MKPIQNCKIATPRTKSMLTNLGGMLLAGILFSLLLFTVENSAESNDRELKIELNLIHEQIGFLRDENQNQNHEIAVLKEMVGANKGAEIRHHEGRELEDSMTMTRHHDSSETARHSKRPVRLLPAYMFERSKNETSQPSPRFYGPPTNCFDLSRLGYTLKGFYMVTTSSTNLPITTIDATKLGTVYCSFKQPEGTFNQSLVEKRIPHLEQDNSSNNITRPVDAGIHFHVIRTRQIGNNPPIDQFVNFDRVNLNLGGIIVQINGLKWVIAPKSGIYQFAFTSVFAGTAKNASSFIVVELFRMSSNNDGDVVGKSSTTAAGNSLAIAATLKLTKGDKIVLVATQGSGYEIGWACFSGSLLEEL